MVIFDHCSALTNFSICQHFTHNSKYFKHLKSKFCSSSNPIIFGSTYGFMPQSGYLFYLSCMLCNLESSKSFIISRNDDNGINNYIVR